MQIYRVTNTINGKAYIGQTVKSAAQRFKQHCKRGHNLHKAILKYGPEAFKVETLAVCNSYEEMDEAEAYYIKSFGTLAPLGYNLESGGNGKKLVSAETRARASIAHRGFRHSAESKAKMSRSRTGLKRSPESVRKSNLGQSVAVRCIETGIVYESVSIAAKTLGLSAGNISQVISGKYSKTKGLSFEKVF